MTFQYTKLPLYIIVRPFTRHASSGVLYNTIHCITVASVGTVASVASVGTVAPVASVGTVASVVSVGTVASVASVGTVASVASVGTIVYMIQPWTCQLNIY